MKKKEIFFPLVDYEKDDKIDTSEVWTLNKDKNKSLTSTVGYVPLEKRIKALILAGENLEAMREEFYLKDEEEEVTDISEYDSKIELLSEMKKASSRINDSISKKSAEVVATEHSEVETATEDSSEVTKENDNGN